MKEYLKGVIGEFDNIRWLKVKQVIILSILVLVASIVLSFLLGLIDRGFLELRSQFLI